MGGAGAVFGLAVVMAAGGHIRFHAQDRMQIRLLGFPVEVNGPIEVAVIGDRDRLLPQPPGALHEGRDLREAVEQAELGVEMQMREHGVSPECSKPGAGAGRRLC